MLPGFDIPIISGTVAPPAPSFVGVGSFVSTTGAATWPSGTVAGDYALIVATGNSAVSATGFSTIGSDYAFGAHTASLRGKILTSGDISSPPTVTIPASGGYYIVTFRNVATAAQKATANSTSSPVTCTGFTKAGSSAFVLAVGADRDPVTPAYVTSWTGIAAGTITYFGMALSYVPSSSYANGTNVNVPLSAGGNIGAGELVEITT